MKAEPEINISASVKKAIVELVQETIFLKVASLSPKGFKKKAEKKKIQKHCLSKLNFNLLGQRALDFALHENEIKESIKKPRWQRCTQDE